MPRESPRMSFETPTTRRNQYFVPGEGIAREVITADICKYLDNDATVRPGEYQGRTGFYIYAYRNLTSEMIKDLQADSERWEKEKVEKARIRALRAQQSGPNRPLQTNRNPQPAPADPGSDRYVDSRTHEVRQIQGPSAVADTPSPGLPLGYPPGRQPPGNPMDYQRPPVTAAPYAQDGHYPVQPPQNYPPQQRPLAPYPEQGYPQAGYIPSPGQEFRGHQQGYDHQRYPQEPPYDYNGGHPHPNQVPPHPANIGRQYAAQPQGGLQMPPQRYTSHSPAIQPPMLTEKLNRDPYYGEPPRGGPRQEPRMDNARYGDDRYYADGRRR